MITCTVCKSNLAEGSEGATAVELMRFVESNYGWDNFDENETFMMHGQEGKVVKARKSWNDSGTGDDYSYLHQGDTFEAFLVFKVGDFFFKKTGTGDSYGEVRWDGDFGPVEMKSKTVTVYDF
jgi:hypothetical protein